MTNHITRRPAGTSAVGVSLLVVLANNLFHANLSVEEATGIVAGATAIVSAIFPNATPELKAAISAFDYPDSTTK